MKIWAIILTVFTASQLFLLTKCDDDEEPHSYTISFFQFDPNALTGGDKIKRESKKDIKPSDIGFMQQLSNNTESDVSNNTVARNTTTEESHQHFDNATENRNKTESRNVVYTENKKNVTGIENFNVTDNKIEDKTPANKTTVSNSTTSLNKINEDKRSHVKHFKPKHTQHKVKQNFIKKDVLNPNPSPSQTEAAMHLEAPQYQGTSTEKENRAKLDKNATLFQQNDTIAEKNNDTASLTEKSVTLEKNGDSKEPEPDTSSVNNEKEEEKDLQKEKNKQNNEAVKAKESDVEKDKSSHEESSNKTVSSFEGQVVEVKKLEKDKKEDNKNVQNSTDVKTGSMENKTESTAEKEAERLAKLEKDKKTNKEIKENAKKIKSVKNSFENNTDVNNVNSTMEKGFKKQTVGRSDLHDKKTSHMTKQASAIYTDEDENDVKDQIARHREQVSHFVPTYSISPKDRVLGFQLGSLKHPKHNIYPQCYHCRRNSTYAHCVQRSTLKSCKKGLNNICFTKSTKKHGVITYKMGCADHKKCSTARAFPCKDGSRECFTCCQFDRCNSSPHHGDYELDELNMEELTLDTNVASYVKPNLFSYLCFIFLNIFMLQMMM